MAHSHHISREMRDCIQRCLDCLSICTETVPHCLMLGGPHAEAAHIRLMLDCAEICRTCAGFMLRASPLHARTCGVCAEVCRLCAGDCDRIAGGDAMMLRCAELCRQCAQSCESMAHSRA